MTNRFVKNDAILIAIDTAEDMVITKLQPLTEPGIEMTNEIVLRIAKEYIDGIRATHDNLNNLKKSAQKRGEE